MYYDFVINGIVVLFLCGVAILLDLSLKRKYSNYLLGVMFGLITIFVMGNGQTRMQSIYFDFRHITMTLVGFIGGPVTALIAAIISSLYRYYVGGSGWVGGIVIIIVFGCFGTILGKKFRGKRNGIKPVYWFLVGILLSIVFLLMIGLFPPWTIHAQVILRIVSGPYLIITPLATTIIFNFYYWAYEFFSKASILNAIINYSPINVVIFDAHGPTLLSKNQKILCQSSQKIEELFQLTDLHKICTNTSKPQDREIATEDGRHFTANLSNFQMPNGEYACVAFVNDITDRTREQEALRGANERFSKAFHGGPIMMTLATVEEGRFIDANEALCSGTGYSREELIGSTTKELNFFVDMDKRQESGKRLVEQGRIENSEFDFRIKSGEIRQGLSWSQLIYLDGQPCHITGLIDVTEQKRIQNEMARLDRLDLVGQLAAGIAHEIRNPMTTVRGYIQLLGTKPDYAAQISTFELMISELDRANAIITEFLSLAQTKPNELKSQNLNDILNNLYPLLEADTFTQNKQIHFRPCKIPDLELNEREITQLILNLTRNGLEAMEERGSLIIKSYAEDSNVVLEIADEGCGIPPEHISKVGIPFFTTKETGIGLGLASCYKIAESHSAKIRIDSSTKGTTFFILFPIPNQGNPAMTDVIT